MIFVWTIIALLVASFGLIVLRGAPYVPTHRRQLHVAFEELYPLSAKDVIVDLGSGDGIVLLAATKGSARAIGYELNPFLVMISRLRLRSTPNVAVVMRDFMSLRRLPEHVTVVYAFTTAYNIDQIGGKMEHWSKGRELAFISYGFKFKDQEPLRSAGPMHLYRFKDGKIKA